MTSTWWLLAQIPHASCTVIPPDLSGVANAVCSVLVKDAARAAEQLTPHHNKEA